MSQILGWIVASILAIGAQTGTHLPPPPAVPAEAPATPAMATPVVVPAVQAQTKPVETKPEAAKPAATKTVSPATVTPKPSLPADTDARLSNDNTYINSSGNTVHSPAYSTDGSVPVGASARCRDGTYSFSQHRRGTCSGHRGVAEWL